MISGLSIEYQVGNVPSGEDTLERMSVAFERAGGELSDFGTHTFPKMVPVFEAELERQFGAEGRGPNVGGWAQLSPAYEEWKGQNYPGKPILERTGALKDALTDSSASHAFRDFSTTEFNFGTAGLEYASFHQSGTGRMPDRPPFDFTADFEREVQRVALEGARDALQASGADEFIEQSITDDMGSF